MTTSHSKKYPKQIETLVEDIYDLFRNGKEVSSADADEFGKAMGSLIARRLKTAGTKFTGSRTLRLSEIGKEDIEIWHGVKGTPIPKWEQVTPATQMKFLFGDIIEELMLFLAKQAGHTVEEQQKQVVLEGVKGSKDCRIDGVTVDVKSASSYSFDKFKDKSYFKEEHGFGRTYLHQIAAYVEGDKGNGYDDERGAFLAVDKTLGHICLAIVDEMEFPNVRKRVNYLKEMVASDEPPPYSPSTVEKGSSGNIALSASDSYNPYKWDIFPNLRGFLYSTGPVYLTKVVKEPDVPEFNKDGEFITKEKNETQKKTT